MSDDISKAIQSSFARVVVGPDSTDEQLFKQAVMCFRQRCVKVSNQCKSDRHGKCRAKAMAGRSESLCTAEFATVGAAAIDVTVNHRANACRSLCTFFLHFLVLFSFLRHRQRRRARQNVA